MTYNKVYSAVSALILAVFLLMPNELCAQVHTDRLGITGTMTDESPDPGGPGPSGRRSSRRSDSSQQAKDAAREINDVLDDILEHVADGRKPSSQLLENAQNQLMSARKYAREMEDEDQAEYFMLLGWAGYFNNDQKEALIGAKQAFKLAPDNPDAQATFAAISMVNGEPVEFMGKYIQREQLSAKRSGSRYGSRGTDRLEFDAMELDYQLIGRKIGPQALRCINSTQFEYQPGSESLCLFLWQLMPTDKVIKQETGDAPGNDPNSGGEKTAEQREAPPQRPENPGNPMMPGGMGGEPMMGMPGGYDGYGGERKSKPEYEKFDPEDTLPVVNWFKRGFDSPKVRFLAVNYDNFANRQAVAETLAETPLPWAVIMANDPANTRWGLKDTAIKKSMVAITNPEGVIIYAGPAESFLPSMLLEDMGLLTAKADPESRKPLPEPKKRDPVQHGVTQNTTEEQPSAQPVQNQEPDSQMAVEDKVWCEQQLSTADGFIKKGHFFGYKQGIDMCRRVIERFPDSTYAEQARKLLGRIPERHHRRYGITPEELGR